MRLNESHVETYRDQGLVIVHDYLPEAQRAAIAAALRACMPPWDAIRDQPNPPKSNKQGFPYPELVLNRFFVEPDLLAFARAALGTEDIYYRNGYSICRYPGDSPNESGEAWHIDNGNNSLLPPTDDARYGQVVVWYWPEEVTDAHAPLRIIPKPHENDTAYTIPLSVPANSLTIFHNFVWHSATRFTGASGQRYSHAGMFGRADFYWEGFQHYTNQARNAKFQELIGSCTAAERRVFRFPPPGHPYYTPQTLAALEALYPGWNARGEYA